MTVFSAESEVSMSLAQRLRYQRCKVQAWEPYGVKNSGPVLLWAKPELKDTELCEAISMYYAGLPGELERCWPRSMPGPPDRSRLELRLWRSFCIFIHDFFRDLAINGLDTLRGLERNDPFSN